MVVLVVGIGSTGRILQGCGTAGEPKSLFEIFAISSLKNLSSQPPVASAPPDSARTSVVIPAWAARWLIIVALIGRRSDRVQSGGVVIAGGFVWRAAGTRREQYHAAEEKKTGREVHKCPSPSKVLGRRRVCNRLRNRVRDSKT
jgi:hypothetical protein